jgi:hypothetical protein
MLITTLTTSLLLISCAAFAADTTQWSNLQTLRPGDRIGIIQSDQKRVEGRFTRVGASEITIDAGQEITLIQNRVVRVYRRPRLTRSKWVLVGAGLGLIAGAIINATAGERFRNEGGDITAGALLGGAGVGAAIAALSGGADKTVYQRPGQP